MKTSKTTSQLIFRVILVCIIMRVLFYSYAYANAGIRGTVLIFGMANASNKILWIASAMVTCILIEGAFYSYFKVLKKPYRISALANIASFFAGIPLAIVGGTIGDWVLTPTLLSIVVEVLVIRYFFKTYIITDSEDRPKKIFWHALIIANVLSNIIIFVYLIIGFARQ